MRSQAQAPTAGSTRRRILVATSAALALLLVLGVSLANAIAPTVTVENATDPTYTTAKVKGTLDRQGQSTTYRFQYVTQASFEAEGWSNPTTGPEATLEEGGPGPQDLEGELSGLAPDTTYHLRLHAENADGSAEALAASTFATEFLAIPSAATEPATAVAYTNATLHGEVDPNGAGAAIDWSFEVSSDGGANWSGAGGGQISAAEAEAASEPIAVSATPQCPDSCLSPDSGYVFRLNASNAAGSATSPEPYPSFETLAVSKPAVAFDPVSGISGETAHFDGTVDPGGTDPVFDSTCAFEYITEANYQARDEKQQLTIKASAGTYTLSLEDQSTDPIPHNATAAQLQAALEALSNVEPGELSVSGGPGNLAGSNPYVITFANANAATLGADPTNLKGAGQASVTTITSGFFETDEVQQLTISANGGTFTVGFEGQSTGPLPYDASAAQLQAALEALSTIGAGNVSLGGGPGATSPYLVTFTGTLGGTNVKQITASQTALTGAGQGSVLTTAQGHFEGFEGAATIPCEPEETVKGDGPQPASADPALEPDTAYRARLAATNLAGTTSSAEQTFTTAAPGPTVAPGTVGTLTSTSARLTAYVDPNNNESTATFEYATDPSFADPTVAPAGPGAVVNGNDNGSQIAFADVSGLTPGTTYHWRVKVASSQGEDVATAPRSFETWPTPGPDRGGVGVEGRRQFELVSTEPHDGQLDAAEISRDGERAIYASFGGNGKSTFGSAGQVWAERTANGWENRSATPPRSALEPPFDNMYVAGMSPELDAISLINTGTLGQRGSMSRAYRYVPATGELTPGALLPSTFSEMAVPERLSSSEDQRHLLYFDQGNTNQLYEFAGQAEPREIGLMLSDNLPACGVIYAAYQLNAQVTSNWISTDGNRAFFNSQGDDCAGPYRLYMREGGVEGHTEPISGEAVSGPEGGAAFLQATPDGSQVFFATGDRLLAADLNQNGDIYRRTVGAGLACLTCSVANADVPFAVSEQPIAVAENGRRVYFHSPRALAPGAIEGKQNLYLWRASDPDRIEFVAPFTGMVATGGSADAKTTPDGAALIFLSNRPELDRLTGSSNGGLSRIYRYDDRDGTLACISCPLPGGSGGGELSEPSVSYSGILPVQRTSNLTPDGRTYFLRTDAQLLGEDVNEAPDIYEWHHGQLALITDGTTVSELRRIAAASDSGRDLLLATKQALIPGAATGTREIYDARVGGGFSRPTPPAPCPGELCRGPNAPVPGEPGAATPGFAGPGNLKPKPPCAKGKVRRSGRCVKKPRKTRAGKAKQHKKRAAHKRAGAKRGAQK